MAGGFPKGECDVRIFLSVDLDFLFVEPGLEGV
jgi:hypothetical protein